MKVDWLIPNCTLAAENNIVQMLSILSFHVIITILLSSLAGIQAFVYVYVMLSCERCLDSDLKNKNYLNIVINVILRNRNLFKRRGVNLRMTKFSIVLDRHVVR